jgi:hypothetical protein
MILIALAALCLLSVPLSGGSLKPLGDLRFHLAFVPLLALALQVLIVTIAPGGNRALHVAIHIASYGLIAVFLGANVRLPGAKPIALGAGSNALAIVLNGGVMPASATALRIANLTVHGGFQNSAHVAHPTVAWLGDVIPVPGPMANVLSVGDCLIFIGALVLLHRTCSTVSPPRVARLNAVEPTP